MSEKINAPERYRTVSGQPLSAGFLKSVFDVRAANAATLATAFNIAVFSHNLLSHESLVIAGAGAVGYGIARVATSVFPLFHSVHLKGNKAQEAVSEGWLKSFRHFAKGVCFDTQNQPTATRGKDRFVSGVWGAASVALTGLMATGAVIGPITAFHARSKGLPVDEEFMRTLPFAFAGVAGSASYAYGALKVATGKWSVVEKPSRAETLNQPPHLS